MPYAGVEALLTSWITATLNHRTVTDVPADLTVAGVLPLYRVLRVGGPSHVDNPRFDMPSVAVDTFGADRAAATDAALDVDEALREQLPRTTTGGATVTRVETITGPHWAPWDDTDVRRFTATYRLYVKARP